MHAATSTTLLLPPLLLLLLFSPAAPLSLSLSSTTSTSSPPTLPAWYHSTQEIYAHFEKLQSNCTLATVTIERYGTNPVIPTITFTGKAAPGAKEIGMILFGEHARELISPETAVRMGDDLCGAHPETRALAEKVLRHTVFHFIPVGNPLGRAAVEAGDFCKRENENNVDLNRNWDDHWENGDNDWGDTAPGDAPFSEPETRSFRDIVVKYKPTTFITVHSGTLGMYVLGFRVRVRVRVRVTFITVYSGTLGMYVFGIGLGLGLGWRGVGVSVCRCVGGWEGEKGEVEMKGREGKM
jgi:hypothetical protein